MGISSPHPIRVARQEQGLTQEVLAVRAGVSVKTLRSIERGDTNPQRSTLAAIYRVLGLDEVAA